MAVPAQVRAAPRPMTADDQQPAQSAGALDGPLHDLIMLRAERVATAGTPGLDQPLDPAAEAESLRALVARHDSTFPLTALVRVWREMTAGIVQMQRRVSVVAAAPPGERALWEVARDHYGSTTPIDAVATAVGAIRAVLDGKADVAVVPWPEDGEEPAWWPMLLTGDSASPRIVSRLPLLRLHAGRGGPEVLAVARLMLRPTGSDRSFLGLELMGPISRSRLKGALDGVGLSPLNFWSRGDSYSETLQVMIEVDGFVGDRDDRMDALYDALGEVLLRARPLGAYPIPLQPRA